MIALVRVPAQIEQRAAMLFEGLAGPRYEHLRRDRSGQQREALHKKRQVPLKRRLVRFILKNPEPMLYHEEPIWRDGIRVGRTTSGMYGHTLGSSIGLGYVEHPEVGDKEFIVAGNFELEIAGTRYPATASLKPMYDALSEKLRC